jgi:hypothetical protein
MVTTYGNSDVHTAGVAASEIPLAMAKGRQYRLAATSAAGLWFRVVKTGGTAAAIATDGSHYLPANGSVPVAEHGERDRISVIREASTDAVAILSETPTVSGL